ncbi:MAG: hypothetical protein DI565_02150 [Ancylobacter novellus]|uniref:Uncharacterized protein n=1 Tax=Ancylobacter novellus TaxID=921 RepID=A0A2W5KQ26_ANCNO|nr:MAG: hypothetical protein DI565_02150 [Ancylobacter novellus]
MWSHPIARAALLTVAIKIVVVVTAGWLVFGPQRLRVDPPKAEARLLSDGPVTPLPGPTQ